MKRLKSVSENNTSKYNISMETKAPRRISILNSTDDGDQLPSAPQLVSIYNYFIFILNATK